MTLFEFWVLRHDMILRLFIEHMRILFYALFFAILIGMPIGILTALFKRVSYPVMMFINAMQAIPSLAILGFLIPIVGVNERTAIILVVVYAILPVVKNTYAGISQVAPQYIEAAKGMGMTQTQMLLNVQLPLALPVIMTGIRISAVAGVGLVTIAAYAGGRGLGFMVFSGINTLDMNMILSGAIPAAILALIMDFCVGRLEKIMTGWQVKK